MPLLTNEDVFVIMRGKLHVQLYIEMCTGMLHGSGIQPVMQENELTLVD